MWAPPKEEDKAAAVTSGHTNDFGTARPPWVSSRNTVDDNLAFLNSSCPSTSKDSIAKIIAELPICQFMVFMFTVMMRPAHVMLPRIARFPQKSKEWLWARTGRITGSAASAAVGHCRYNRPLTKVNETVYKSFESNPATEWGSGKEVYGTKAYVNDLEGHVRRAFRQQRLAAARQFSLAGQAAELKQKWTHFEFRGAKIPVVNIHTDPIVEVRNFALMIQAVMNWRGMSPDGVIFINGMAVGCLEVKCPYKKQHSLYPNIYTYYYDQLQCELYLCNKYWDTVQWLDFVNWTPDGFTVDAYHFDQEYFQEWYLPREMRYYFGAYLPEWTYSLRTQISKSIYDLPGRIKAFYELLKQKLSCPEK